jgi:hypothetical protein
MTIGRNVDHGVRRLRKPRSRRPTPGPLWLALIIFTVALATLFSVGHVLWPRWPDVPSGGDAPALPVTVGGVIFNIPPAAIRQPVQRRAGAQERVDLAFLWPSLEPPDPSAKPPPRPPDSPSPRAPPDRIFVTIAAAGDTLAPADRVLTIYPRYAAAEAVEGPDGLIILPFREGTPYQGEDLIYDAAAPRFLARCSRSGPGGTPGTCLYELRIGRADLVLRFPRDWLADWRPLAANLERLIAKLDARISGDGA